jgi:hypothetical protein
VRTRKDLVANRIATTNQLRAQLELVFPGAVGLFADLDSPISLSFLERFPTATKAAWLSETRLAAWLRASAYSGRTPVAELLGRLQAAPRGRHGAAATAQAEVTRVLVQVLRSLLAGIDRLEAQIAEQLALHPDGFIFQSLPRAGTIRAAAMLAEIGDCRARFPTPRCARLPRRRRSLDTQFRQASGGDLPLGLRQEAASPNAPPPGEARAVRGGSVQSSQAGCHEPVRSRRHPARLWTLTRTSRARWMCSAGIFDRWRAGGTTPRCAAGMGAALRRAAGSSPAARRTRLPAVPLDRPVMFAPAGGRVRGPQVRYLLNWGPPPKQAG